MHRRLQCNCERPVFRRECQRGGRESAGDWRTFSGLRANGLNHRIYRQTVRSLILFFMNDSTELKAQIKQMVVENCMLKISAAEIGDDHPLFGPHGLGLDSIDALQLVVAVEKQYGLKLSDVEVARKVMQTVNTIAVAIHEYQSLTK
jgi:acyl carrier protein